jgi:hypothetical protein
MAELGPFPLATAVYEKLSDQLSQVAATFQGEPEIGSGATVAVLRERNLAAKSLVENFQQEASLVVNQSASQAEHDSALASAPSANDRAMLQAALEAARARMISGQISPADFSAIQDEYLNQRAQRNDAVQQHAIRTAETEFPVPSGELGLIPGFRSMDESGVGPSGTGFPDDEFPSDEFPPDEEPPSGVTQISSDGSAVAPAGAGQLSAPSGQPAMQPMAMSQQPMSAPMPMAGAGFPGGQPAPAGRFDPEPDMDLDDDLDSLEEDPYEIPDMELDTDLSTGTGLPDQGYSVSGVTTRADVSGITAPVVGVGGTPAAGGSSSTRGMLGGGMMPMAPMMGGAGMGGGGMAKERPVILSQDPDLSAKESLEHSVESGLLGRSSSQAPTQP